MKADNDIHRSGRIGRAARAGRIVAALVLGVGLFSLLGCRGFEGQYREQGSGAPAETSGGASEPAGQAEPSEPEVASSSGTSSSGGRRGGSDPFREAMEEIEAARNLPVESGNVMVQVERIWFNEAESSAIGALIGYADENISVAAGGLSSDAGFRVGAAGGGFFGALDGHMRSSRSTSREQAFLTMMPGYPASLAIGQTRYVIPFVVGGVEYGLIQPGGQFVGTSLEALSQMVGEDRIQVQLTPIFSGLGPGGGPLRVTEASTTVVVQRGQPLLIASHGNTVDNVATSLLSRRTERGNEQAVLILTVK